MVSTRIDLNSYSGVFDNPCEAELLHTLKEHFKLLDTDDSPSVLTKTEYEKIRTQEGASGKYTDRNKGAYSWDKFHRKFQAVVGDAKNNALVRSPNSLKDLYAHLYPYIQDSMIDFWTSPRPAILHVEVSDTETEMNSNQVGQARVNCKTLKRDQSKYGEDCKGVAWHLANGYDLARRIGNQYTCFPTLISYEFAVAGYSMAFVQQLGAAICEQTLNSNVEHYEPHMAELER